MKRMSLPAQLVAVVLMVLALVTGCGGSDSSGAAIADEGDAAAGPPTDATVEDFCGTFMDMIQQASDAGSNMSDAEAIKVAKQTADKLAEIGTPEDIPAGAREAFELAIDKIRSIPDDATRQEMDAIADDLTDEERKNLDALTTYVTATCMSVPSDLPSDMPSS